MQPCLRSQQWICGGGWGSQSYLSCQEDHEPLHHPVGEGLLLGVQTADADLLHQAEEASDCRCHDEKLDSQLAKDYMTSWEPKLFICCHGENVCLGAKETQYGMEYLVHIINKKLCFLFLFSSWYSC